MSASLDIQLGRLDVHHIGANRRHCLQLLRSSKGKKDKLVTGGEDGVVQLIAVKKGETQVHSQASTTRRGGDGLQWQQGASYESALILLGACCVAVFPAWCTAVRVQESSWQA